MKLFRCWFFDGSAMMVHAESHDEAATKAHEMSVVNNADLDRPGDRREFRKITTVKSTDCLSDGTKQPHKKR